MGSPEMEFLQYMNENPEIISKSMTDPQELTITLRFKTEHTPGNDEHLTQIAKHYLKPKGVTLSDDRVIEI